jgi:hypothetical protein
MGLLGEVEDTVQDSSLGVAGGNIDGIGFGLELGLRLLGRGLTCMGGICGIEGVFGVVDLMVLG